MPRPQASVLASFACVALASSALGQLPISPTLFFDMHGSSSSHPAVPLRFGASTLFRATTPPTGIELHKTDGTLLGTRLAADVTPGGDSSFAVPLVEIDAGMIVAAVGPGVGTEPWLLDTAGNLTLLADTDPGPVGFLGAAAKLGERALFLALVGDEGQLWETDGTPAGTQRVPGTPTLRTESWHLNDYAVVGGALLFGADDSSGRGIELWRTDGTGAGTELVMDTWPGAADGGASGFVELGGLAWFSARTPAAGDEPWVSDGTPGATLLLGDVNPGSAGSEPRSAVEIGGTVLFSADDGTHGRELWVSDGTPAGTQLLADLVPGAPGSDPRSLTRAGDVVFFFATSAGGVVQLWKSDGTAAGTVLVNDGSVDGLAYEAITPVGDGEHVVFRATHPIYGLELYWSNGTTAGTGVLADSAPGPANGYPSQVFRHGDVLFFTADDQATGAELHAVPATVLGAWAAETYGYPCGGRMASSGKATLGSTLTIQLSDAGAFLPAFLFYSTSAATLPLGGCDLYLGAPLPLAARNTGATGSSQVPLTVPNDATLAGALVHFQWLVLGGGPLFGVASTSDGLEVLVGP